MKTQFGRSMIEMLGVLAIIGVISIGGISLYRRAVDTNKANNIFDDVNRFEFVISERVFRTPRGFIDKADFKPISGFDMTAYNEPELSSHHISVLSVPKSVCRIVLDKGEKDYVMFANNLMFEGDSSICTQDLNEMRFYFGDTSDLCSFPAPNTDQFACSNDCLCDNDRVCKPDIYNPDSIPKMTEETVCCPKDNDIVACNGQCISNDCGTGKTLDRKTCQCVCADSMKQIDENGNCTCKPDTSGIELSEDENGNCKCPNNKPYYFDESSGGPACCAAGYTPVDGICHRLHCEGTTCYLDGVMCGQGCSTTTDEDGNTKVGVNCSEGNCHAEECSAKLSGAKLGKVDINSKNIPHYWCVVGEDDGKICAIMKGETNPRCYSKGMNDTAGCGYADTDLNMLSGLCDVNYCSDHFSNLDSDVTYTRINGRRRGCLFPNHDNIYCQPWTYKDVVSNGKTERVPDIWYCYFETIGTTAGSFCSGCLTPESCLSTCGMTCSTGVAYKHNGLWYCCDNATSPALCQKGGVFYFASDWNKCGMSCDWTTGLCTSWGSCSTSSSIPDCKIKDKGGNITTCSNGFTCGSAIVGGVDYGYGCINETKGVICYHYYGEGEIHCAGKSTGKRCGNDCDLGGHCNTAYMPECAKSDPTSGKPYCPTISTGYDMGTDSANPTCLCKYGDGTAASVTKSGGHYYCCPSGHTYINGACSAN